MKKFSVLVIAMAALLVATLPLMAQPPSPPQVMLKRMFLLRMRCIRAARLAFCR